MTASRVNSEALKSFWKFLADKIVAFGKWAGFAGVAGCVYAYAFLLGVAYQFSYFHLNGVNILSYMEPADFLTPGYSLAAFFLLMTLLVVLLLLPLYHLVRLIVRFRLPLYVEILATVLSFFAKRIPKTSLFVLCCTVWVFSSLLVAAGAGDIWPPSQDCVSIVTDPPFQYQPEYIRIGSTSNYLFLREGAGGCQVSSTGDALALKDLIAAIKMWLGTVWAWLQTMNTWPETVWAWLQTINTWPEAVWAWLQIINTWLGTAWDWLEESLWAEDERKPDTILVVPLSKITCIGETTENGAALCRPAAVKSPPTVKDLVAQHIAGDMQCRTGTKLITSDFVPFVYNKGDEIAECAGTEPRSKEKWKQEIQEFVHPKKDKARKWKVYGLASLDGDSAENDDLSRKRAETVRDMMCDTSETWSSIKKCQEEVEIRYLGENHLVTAGPKSRSAVIAVCVPALKENPEKTASSAR